MFYHLRKRLNRRTVPPIKMQPGGTDPSFKVTLDVPLLKMQMFENIKHVRDIHWQVYFCLSIMIENYTVNIEANIPKKSPKFGKKVCKKNSLKYKNFPTCREIFF